MLWEILLIEGQGKIRLDRPPIQWVRAATARERVEIVAISVEIASQAIAHRGASPGDPADRLIAATARVLDAPVVTRDERIASLPGIRAVW